MTASPTSPSRYQRIRRWRPSRRTGIVLGVLGVALLVLWLLFDWNWFKRPLERAVSGATGREFRIDGDLDVDLGRTITVSADRLRLANASWSKEARMGTAERVEIDIAPWPLLALRLRMKEVRATRADLWLETGPDGTGGNWLFDDGKDEPAGEPRWRLDRLWIEDSRLRFTDAAEKTDIAISLDSVRPGRGARPAGAGHIRSHRSA